MKKRSRITLLWMTLVLCLGVNSNVIGQVNYRIKWITFPGADYLPVKAVNNQGLVVGFVADSDVNLRSGYVYDQNGVLGGGAQLYLLDELIDIPADIKDDYPESRIDGVNEHGHVVGELRGSEIRMGFFADLNDPTSFQALPNPTGVSNFRGWRINDHSDVLVQTFTDTAGYTYHLYNPLDPSAVPELLKDPVTNLPIPAVSANIALNNTRQVVGDSSETVFRLTPGILLETFEGLERSNDVNDSGEFTGTAPRATGNRKKKNSTFTPTAFRYSDSLGFEFVSEAYSNAWSINNSGDVVGEEHSLDILFTFHGDFGYLNLDDLVVGTNEDLEFWFAADKFFEGHGITDRDLETGFGQLVGRARVGTTTGKGRNRVTTYESRIFILTPELP